MARKLGGASGAGDELLDVVVIGGSQAGLARPCSASSTKTPPTWPAASPAAPPAGQPAA